MEFYFLFFLLSTIPSYHYAFSSSSPSSKTKIKQTPVVICPGFGNDSIDYLRPLSQPRSTSFIASLERRGFNPSLIYTVPIKRIEWARVIFGGLLDIPRFYTGNALPTGLGYGWYVQRLKETVDRVYEESGEKVLLVGHSAGGWLARAAMSDGVWCDNSDDENEGIDGRGERVEEEQSGNDRKAVIRTADRISCLVTIGAIHKVPADPATCVTRGVLKNTDQLYPGALLRDEGVGYVTVGGSAIMGVEGKNSDKSNYSSSLSDADDLYSVRGEGSASKVAYTSYKSVCGEGNVIGDGVVPLAWTGLDGAKNIELDGVIHSINEAGTTLPTDKWYGSDGVIDQWLPTALKEAGIDSDD